MALLNFLKEKFKDKGQIFITTHSSIFTSKDEISNTFLVTKGSTNGTEIKQIIDKKDFRFIKNELGHKNVDLFFYDMVVFIEGDSEEKAFPIIANALTYDFDELGIQITNIKGKDKIKRIKEFLEYIKDSDVTPFIIVDKTKDIENHVNDLIKAKLLGEGNYHIWSKGDFEDSFSEQHIIKAITETYGSGIDLTEDELREKRKNKPTVKIIEEKLHVKNLGSLNKPAFGEGLGLIIKNDIENIKDKRQEAEIEEVLHNIVKKLQK